MTKEKSTIDQISIHELAKKIICDGNIYLCVGKHKVLLLRPGIFLDAEFVKKYATKEITFEYQCVLEKIILQKFKKYLSDFKEIRLEKELRNNAEEFIQYFQKIYDEENHFLNFALACYEEFCKVSHEHQNLMHQTDIYLFKKALYSSAFSILFAISNGFYDAKFLQDIYQVVFMLDSGICNSNYTYFVAQACNQENSKPGSGMEYLSNKGVTDVEKKIFWEHPEKSYHNLKEQDLLYFPEMAQAVLYQHELSNGSGFPRGIHKAFVSSWEEIVILADSLVEITPEINFERSVINYLKNYKDKRLNDIPVDVVLKNFYRLIGEEQITQETGT